MMRVVHIWDFTVTFLEAVSRSPLMFNAIQNSDHRSKLMNELSTVFVHFINHWHQMHSDGNTKKSIVPRDIVEDEKYTIHFQTPETYLNYLLQDCMTISTHSLPASGVGDDSSIEVFTNGFTSSKTALRHDMFAVFTILQFIGNSFIKDISVDLWVYTVRLVNNEQGNPTQLLALSIFIKLVYTEYLKHIRQNGNYESNIKIINILSNNISMKFFMALMEAHPKYGDNGNPQWSTGIDEMLRAAEYMRAVLPRSICSKVSERPLFSNIFRKDNSGLIMSLAYLLGVNCKNGYKLISVDMMQLFLTASKDIPTSNEDDSRAANSTRAEIFAGLCRHLNDAAMKAGLESESLSLLANLWQILTTYFIDQMDKASLDYCNDWAEALLFGFSDYPIQSTDTISSHVLEQIRRILRTPLNTNNNNDDSNIAEENSVTTGAESINVNVSCTANEEGFASQAKVFVIAKALLRADIAANISCGLRKDSYFGSMILSLLNEPTASIVSPYRTSRDALIALLTYIVDISYDNVDMMKIIDNLKSQILKTEQINIHTNAVDEPPSDTITVVDLVVKDEVEESLALLMSNTSKNIINNTLQKHIYDFSSRLLESMFHLTLQRRSFPLYGPLIKFCINGSGHPDPEVSKYCREVCLMLLQSIAVEYSTQLGGLVGGITDVAIQGHIEILLEILLEYSSNVSRSIRETLLTSVVVLYDKYWMIINTNDRKRCRDVFNIGLLDARSDIQQLSMAGMSFYLSIKSKTELQNLATAYIKNSDVFAQR